MQFDQKSKHFLFFIFLYVPTIALLLLVGSANLTDYITTTFYIILAVVCLVVLGTMIKSDDKYYRTLNFTYLIAAIFTGFIMTVFSWGLSLSLKNPRMLLSINTLNLLPMPTSVSFMFLSVLVSGLVLAATSEELFKLTIFAEAKERWGKTGYKLGPITIPGILIYAAFPVAFWAAMHGILSYSNPVMIIPAFVNGIILIILLWQTKCILACIASHWIYNALIAGILFINGQAGVPAGTPLFPNIFNVNYFSNSGFIYDALLGAIVIGAVLFFLVPSLTKHK
jgi:hypothetical protein